MLDLRMFLFLMDNDAIMLIGIGAFKARFRLFIVFSQYRSSVVIFSRKDIRTWLSISNPIMQ